MRDEKFNSFKIQNPPPHICTDSSSSGNASSNVSLNVQSEIFSMQDEEPLEILGLQKSSKGTIGEMIDLKVIFAQTVFNLGT